MQPTPTLNLDEIAPEVFNQAIANLEDQDTFLVDVRCSLTHWDRLKTLLMGLRASGISPILHLVKADTVLEDNEIQFLFDFLRDWDQLLLENFLEICGEWVPQAFQQALMAEAANESRWFREWQAALSDKRVAKYPNLPWRSYVRKINTENHAFATAFLKRMAEKSTEASRSALDFELEAFLKQKKKVVCVFPKKWGANA